MKSILAELSAWHAALPRELHVRLSSSDQPVSREAVSVYLHYSQCVIMASRPLLFQVVRNRLQGEKAESDPDWRQDLPPATTAIVEACVTAAHNTTAIMSAAAKDNLVATYGYQDTEHAFSAALILVMINIAFPFNNHDYASMQKALGILDGMGERGGEHARYLHSLLSDLIPAIEVPQQNQHSARGGGGGGGISAISATIEPIGSRPLDRSSTHRPAHLLLEQSDQPADDEVALTDPYINLDSLPFMDDLMWEENMSADANFCEAAFSAFDINVI